MKEADWLTCSRVNIALLNWLRRRGSDRQFYLVAAGCVRQVEANLTSERFRALVPMIERYADGAEDRETLARAHRQAENEIQERIQALQLEGLSLARASKRLAADVAATHAALPGGGWQAACSALWEAVRVGKRADLWPRQCQLLRDIFGNPFRPVRIEPAWRTSSVLGVARHCYAEQRWDTMPILADALVDSGCTDADILAHCRQPGPHYRGCWVLDVLLENG